MTRPHLWRVSKQSIYLFVSSAAHNVKPNAIGSLSAASPMALQCKPVA